MRRGPQGPSALPLLWRRAAVLGSLWAASEIVLGSFLHNLRVPLSGHVLTSLAIVILVAGHRSWPAPGLLVRAGLIAALMKSISPSAVLLGPMVAIAMEGALLEVGVRLVGARTLGYVLGGALAMSWTLGQKFVSLLLTYGPDLVVLYRELVASAGRQLGPLPLGPWGPLVLLAVLNVAVGVAAALAGAAVRPERAPGVGGGQGGEIPGEWRRRLGEVPGGGVRPLLPLLVLWIVALPLGLAGFTRLPLEGKALLASAAVLVAAGRYGRALRRLGRPGFWVALVGVTLMAGVIMGALSPSQGSGWAGGLALGMGMALHAVFVTMCFAALSTELSHPRLRRWLEGVGGGQLHRAVHAAFSTLPLAVAALPRPSAFLREPLRTLGRILPRMEEWLLALQEPLPVVGVLSGERGEGKTTRAGEVVEALRREEVRVGGILAPGEMRDGRRWAFDLVDVASGRRIPMATRSPDAPWPELGAFRVNPEALVMGREALSSPGARGYDLLLVDEVGPWELQGEGWAPALEALRSTEVPIFLVVRRSLLSDVLARFVPPGVRIWDVGAVGCEVMAGELLSLVRGGGRGSIPMERAAR